MSRNYLHRVGASKPVFCATKLPWHEHQFRLISWLEMNNFSVAHLFALGQCLGVLVKSKMTGDSAQKWFLAKLRLVERHAKSLCLKQSEKCAARMIKRIDMGPIIKITLKEAELSDMAIQIVELVHGEMEDQLFLWVPPGIAEAYTQDLPYFGEAVAEKFPSASYDIEEAGKCFALGRSTASVLHCMRVLEHGLSGLCLTLELPFIPKTWTRVLEAIEKRIAVLDSQVKQKSAWKKKRQFYTEAIAEFKHFKDAWRNHAAHGRDHYGDERAEKIITHARGFMQTLATRLKERKG